MTETCPVCGDGVEHRRVERAEPDGTVGGTASFDVVDLCAVDEDTRWDRICTAATTDNEGRGDDAPVLSDYYHFSGA